MSSLSISPIFASISGKKTQRLAAGPCTVFIWRSVVEICSMNHS
jgi:hypothetical protein